MRHIGRVDGRRYSVREDKIVEPRVDGIGFGLKIFLEGLQVVGSDASEHLSHALLLVDDLLLGLLFIFFRFCLGKSGDHGCHVRGLGLYRERIGRKRVLLEFVYILLEAVGY